MTKILLYSGGMDSWLIDKLWKPDICMYVDMHTRYSDQEIKKITARRDDVKIVEFPLGQWEEDNAIIPLRNLYLLMVACNTTGFEDVEICYGATLGDRSKDQSLQFQEKAEDILNYLYSPQSWIPKGKHIKIIHEYERLTKTEMLEIYLNNGGTLEEAFESSLSCYNPDKNGEPCWNCKPCFRKFVAFDCLGYKFTTEVIKKNMVYCKQHILPELAEGTYRCEREDRDVRSVVDKYRRYL